MRLMRAADVPWSAGDRTFSHSRTRAAFAVAGIVAVALGLLAIGRLQDAGLAYYLAGVLCLAAWVFRKLVLARFCATNWLVRMGGEGVFIQFRSYLNQHFPASDVTVVFIPYGEIRAVSRVDECSDVPYRELDPPFAERTATRRRRLVEFRLAGDTVGLAHAIAEERERHPPGITRYKHYPVRVTATGRLQVAWTVTPGADAFLAAMRQHVAVAASAEARRDYGALSGMSRDAQDEHLRALIDAGQAIDAIHLARKLHALDLKAARDHVDRLRRGGRTP